MKLHRIALAAAAALCCLLVSDRAQAQGIYLEIPGVPGEVVSPVFPNQIAVSALSWGGSKICTGPLQVQDINFTKSTDTATTTLMSALRDGTVYPTITFRFARSDDQVYQSYRLTNARLSSISTGGAASDPRTTDSVSMTFSQALITYTFIFPSGKPGGTSSTTIVSSACP